MNDKIIAMASGKHKKQYVSFTGGIAEKTSEIIVRELGIKNLDICEE